MTSCFRAGEDLHHGPVEEHGLRRIGAQSQADLPLRLPELHTGSPELPGAVHHGVAVDGVAIRDSDQQVLSVGVDRLCPECGEWTVVCSVGNVDFMNTDSWDVGAVAAEHIAGEFVGYQLEESRELLEQALHEIDKTPCCKCIHEWTPIAQDREPDGYDPDPPVWQWCIRCGRLKLGSQVFSPGPNQLSTPLPDAVEDE